MVIRALGIPVVGFHSSNPGLQLLHGYVQDATFVAAQETTRIGGISRTTARYIPERDIEEMFFPLELLSYRSE